MASKKRARDALMASAGAGGFDGGPPGKTKSKSKSKSKSSAPVDLRSAGAADQFAAVLDYLRAVPGYTPVAPAAIEIALDVPVLGNVDLLSRLAAHPKIKTREVDGFYYFQPELDIRNKEELLRYLSERDRGVPASLLEEAYPGCKDDLMALRRDAEIIYVKSVDSKSHPDAVFARTGPRVLVSLDHSVTLQPKHTTLSSSGDLSSSLFRGDAVLIEGKVYRVSDAVLSGNSVNSEYRSKFDETGGHWSAAHTYPHRVGGSTNKHQKNFRSKFCQCPACRHEGPHELPLDRPLADDAVPGMHAEVKRFGCTSDIRVLWRDAVSPSAKTTEFKLTTKYPGTHDELRVAMARAKIRADTDWPMEKGTLRSTKTFEGPSARQRRRRARVRTKLSSNLHITGEKAAELQREFKAIQAERAGRL